MSSGAVAVCVVGACVLGGAVAPGGPSEGVLFEDDGADLDESSRTLPPGP